jgi:GNAT superfamily N-acetyltransferase
LNDVSQSELRGLRRDHFLIAIGHMLARLLSPLGTLSLELLLERDLTTTVEPISAGVPVTIREATDADLDRLTFLYSQDSYLYLGDEPISRSNGRGCGADSEMVDCAVDPKARKQYWDRVRRGEKCFLALIDSEIAHVNWLCFSWGEAVPGHPIFLQPGEVYTTDAFTADKFRGQNIHAHILSEMLRYAQNKGYLRAYAVTRLTRHASMHAFHQLGWRTVGKLLCFIPRRTNRCWFLKLSGRIDPLFRQPTIAGRAG